MKRKFSNTGISLISLIITIIVIIILAAIVIFSGMDTPEKAQLSKVISDIDNVQTAVDQAYYGLYTEKAVAGEVWTPSQFYEAVATGEKNRDNLTGTGLIEIAENSLVDINLPKYEGRKWYIAVSDVSDTIKTGSAVLSPGFESQGKTYATLLDIQTGGSDGNGTNGGSQGGLTEEESAKLASIEIGDFVDGYMNIDGVSWRVIDKDETTGEILITTSDAVESWSYSLAGSEDYIDIATKGENSKLNQYCKTNYSAGKGETNVRSMTAEDMEKLCSRYGITKEEYPENKYAYYHPETEVEVKDVEVIKNGEKIVYKGVKLGSGIMGSPLSLNSRVAGGGISEIDEDFFLTYDDENGNTYTATRLEKSEEIGDGGYRVLEKDKPVLVSTDYYWYDIPSEVQAIIGTEYSWLASACVFAASNHANFDVRRVDDGNVDADDVCYSNGLGGGASLGVRPVVSLSSKLLEQGSAGGDVTGGYNTWKLK